MYLGNHSLHVVSTNCVSNFPPQYLWSNIEILIRENLFPFLFLSGIFFFFWPQSSLHTSVIQYFFFFLVHTFCPKEVTQNFLLSCFSCPLFSPSPCNRYFYHFAFRWLGFPSSSADKESACNAGDPGLIPALGRSAGEGIGYPLQYSWASLVAQLVKNLPAMWETWVWSLGWEDLLEKGLATHSSILGLPQWLNW